MTEKTRDDIKAEYMAEYDKAGEELVRLRVDKGTYTSTRLAWALEWLAKKDQEARRKSEASSDEQIQITRSAKNAAWMAAIVAIVAAIVATVAAVISFVALARAS